MLNKWKERMMSGRLMDPVTTADIIPFPGTRQTSAVTPVVAAVGDNERLNRALATLAGALADQSAALSAWRSALSDLHDSAAALGQTMGSYRDRLDQAGSSAAALRTEAGRLARWADRSRPTA
jgi:hypothetical protein